MSDNPYQSPQSDLTPSETRANLLPQVVAIVAVSGIAGIASAWAEMEFNGTGRLMIALVATSWILAAAQLALGRLKIVPFLLLGGLLNGLCAAIVFEYADTGGGRAIETWKDILAILMLSTPLSCMLGSLYLALNRQNQSWPRFLLLPLSGLICGSVAYMFYYTVLYFS